MLRTKKVFYSLFDDFQREPSRLRSNAMHVYHLNLTRPPSADPRRRALRAQAVDMSVLPDDLALNLQSAKHISEYKISWRTNLEYLTTFPVEALRTPDGTPKQRRKWSTTLMDHEQKLTGYEDFYFSVVYHSFTPTIESSSSFIFVYGLSLIRGAPDWLEKFDDFVHNDTGWADKNALIRGISV